MQKEGCGGSGLLQATRGWSHLLQPTLKWIQHDSLLDLISVYRNLQNVHWMLEHFSRFNYFETVFCLFGHSGFYLMFVVPLIDVFCIIYNTLWKVRFKMHAFFHLWVLLTHWQTAWWKSCLTQTFIKAIKLSVFEVYLSVKLMLEMVRAVIYIQVLKTQVCMACNCAV